MKIDDIRLIRTCEACPEQYDAFDQAGNQIAYLRLRHGYFTVKCPDVGGELVYSGEPSGDGRFEDKERGEYLFAAKTAIAAYYNASYFECPLGGDTTNDCDGCIYSVDYHFVDGECIRRE